MMSRFETKGNFNILFTTCVCFSYIVGGLSQSSFHHNDFGLRQNAMFYSNLVGYSKSLAR